MVIKGGKFLFLIILVSLLTACGEFIFESEGDDVKDEGGDSAVRVGTSSSGSVLYNLGVGMTEIFDSETSLNASVEPVGGSDANLFALEDEHIELGVTNGFASYNAFHGMEPFEDHINVRLVAQGQPTFRQILVRTDAEINSVEDLEGKTLAGIRPSLPELEIITDALLEVHGINENNVDVVTTMDTEEVDEGFETGSLDAAIYPASLNSPLVNELIQHEGVEILDIEKEKVEEMLELLPDAISHDVIPSGTYSNQTEDLNALSFNTYLTTREDVPEETISELTEALFENHDEFSNVHSAAEEWTIERSLEDPDIPYHKGAIQYFEEVNEWNDELESTQEELSELY